MERIVGEVANFDYICESNGDTGTVSGSQSGGVWILRDCLQNGQYLKILRECLVVIDSVKYVVVCLSAYCLLCLLYMQGSTDQGPHL